MKRRNGADPARGGITLEEIAGELGVTRERVRQIERIALNKLRAAMAEQELTWDDFFGSSGAEAPGITEEP